MSFESRKRIALCIVDQFHREFDRHNEVSRYERPKKAIGRRSGNENMRSILANISAFDADCRAVTRKMKFPEVPVIWTAVKELYEYNDMSSYLDDESEKSMKACIRNWIPGMTGVRRHHVDKDVEDVEDQKDNKDKRCLWIDAFSALNHRYHCFSDENTAFGEFLVRYSKFISDVDNTAMVGISPRSLYDIAEAYCVYFGKTQFHYKELCQKLLDAKKAGVVSEAPDYGQTRLIKTDLVNLIANSEEGDSEILVERLCGYVSEHADRFEIERNFCIVAETLENLQKYQFINPAFLGDEIVRVFTDMSVDYAVKEKSLAKLKTALFRSIFGNPDGNPTLSYASSLLCKSRYPGLVGNIHCVLSLLRLTAVVGIIETYETANLRRKMGFHDDKNTVIAAINGFLQDLELPGIGEAPSKTFGREIDDCVFTYLSNSAYIN